MMVQLRQDGEIKREREIWGEKRKRVTETETESDTSVCGGGVKSSEKTLLFPEILSEVLTPFFDLQQIFLTPFRICFILVLVCGRGGGV